MQTIKYNQEIESDLARKRLILDKKNVLSGNIFLDKPWVVNYPEQAIVTFDTKQTLYTTFVNSTVGRENNIAIIIPDTDEVYTYAQLLTLIDSTANALSKYGIQNGSIIGAMLNNTIEEPVLLLAANKLGATIKFIDYTKSGPAIVEAVKELPIDLLVLDEMMMPVEPKINDEKKPVIVAGTHRRFKRGHYLSFGELQKLSDNQEIPAVEYQENKTTLVINSSGTTGNPKPIAHSDYSVNSAAQKMLFSNYPITENNMMLKIIPPQIGLGIITSLYTSLIAGSPITLIRGANAEDSIMNTLFFLAGYKEFIKSIGMPEDTKLNIFTSPMYYRIILTQPFVHDLSFVSSMLAAGSKMTEEELIGLNALASQKGCTVPISNGYGQNEMGGAVTLNDPIYNKNGSAGYPVIGTDVMIVNPTTLKPVKPYETGIILERSESSFVGYANSPENTTKAYITLPNGEKWFDTKDLGHIDEDGFIYITGRSSRVIIRHDFKIPLDAIEGKIKQLPFVKDCALIVTSQSTSSEGLDAYISIKEEYLLKLEEKDVKNELFASGILNVEEFPDNIDIMEELPYLASGKIDYQSLNKKSQERIAKLNKKQ